MPSYDGATAALDHSPIKSKKPKYRQVSSRFLNSISSSSSSIENGNQFSNTSDALIRQNSKSSTLGLTKQKSSEKSGFFRGLWPSSSSLNPKPDHTLADCIGYDRATDNINMKNKSKHDQLPSFLIRQRSCTELSRFDEDEKKSSLLSNVKENHKPLFGGSMRYTGKLKIAPTAKSSYTSGSNRTDEIVPGRFSVDENSLRKPLGLSDDSESEYSENSQMSSFSYMASTVSSRKHGVKVPSKFLRDLSSKSRRSSSDLGRGQKPESESTDNSPKIYSIKKENSSWASSPGRVGSPKAKLIGLANSKPPTSPSRAMGVGNILSLGIEMLKGKKTSSAAGGSASPLGPSLAESVHQWRLLQSRLMQWRYGNARAEVVNGSAMKQAEKKLLHAWNALIKLHYSVLQKRLQLQRDNLDWKLIYILPSQIKKLEMWGSIERQHSSAVSMTKDCLHSIVCRIPLVDGATVELQTTSAATRHATDVVAAINSTLTTFHPAIEETMGVLSELAMVVTREKQLLEECLELYANICTLEVRERSLKSSIMQFNLLQQRQQSLGATTTI